MEASKRSVGKISKERYAKIRKARESASQHLPENIISKVSEDAGIKTEKAQEQYPFGRDLKMDAERAIVRKKVSEAMFGEDVLLPHDQQVSIIDRQIARFYDYEINAPGLRGHVEAHHGTAPVQTIIDICDKKKLSSHDEETNAIAANAMNWMVCKKPRLFTDINNLPFNLDSSLRSEGAVFTKEYNLNAVKAQRDLTFRLLRSCDCVDADEKVKSPYLAVYVHGKVDTRGHDIEIGAKQVDGKGPLDPRVAIWIADKLRSKIAKYGMKNAKGELCSVNVVTYNGSYSGSPALTRMRYGDDVLGFKGFGENFQALQMELGKFVRYNHKMELKNVLDELITEFNDEFMSFSDFGKIDSNVGRFEKKRQQEITELFSRDKLFFSEDIKESHLALAKVLRDELGVQAGDFVIVAGIKLKVIQPKLSDVKSGKSAIIHKSMEKIFDGGLVVEKVKSNPDENSL